MAHIYGQFVIGPPGSGKTTYCKKMSKLLEKDFGRKVAIVNLDPANKFLDFTPAVDINSLITVDYVMANFDLGPNGSLVYCMEVLEKHYDWLYKKCIALKDHYFIFDCPGQIELYSHHESLRNILRIFMQKNFHICTVHLVDSHYCSEPGKFISSLLMTLSVMLQMETPHINVLSKVDIFFKHNSEICFGLDFYTKVLDLNRLLDAMDVDPFDKKYKKLNEAMIDLVERHGLVSFIPLNINDKETLIKVKNEIDKANGYIYGTGERRTIQSLLGCAVGASRSSDTFNYTLPDEVSSSTDDRDNL